MHRFVLLTLVLILIALPARAQDTVTSAQVVAQTIERVIRPGYVALAKAAGASRERAEVACSNPSPDRLADLRSAFADLAVAHARIEFVRFGPVSENNRIERFLLWPDRRGIALRQVQDVLARRDASVLAPDTLAEKSVALQGLTALEYLLYGEGADAIATEGNWFRCGFAQAILSRMASVSAEIVAEWEPEADIVRRMTHPSPADARYRSDGDALEEIFAAASHGLEALRDVKLRPGLGKPGEAPKPALFPYRRSVLTRDALAADAAGLAALISDGGLFALLPPASQWAGPSVELEFETMQRALSSLDRSVPEAAELEAGRAALETVALAIKGVETVLVGEVAPALGLSAGFSSLDGD